MGGENGGYLAESTSEGISDFLVLSDLSSSNLDSGTKVLNSKKLFAVVQVAKASQMHFSFFVYSSRQHK